MASYTLTCIAFLVIFSFSILELGSATRSGPTSKPDSSIRAQSELATPPHNTNNNNNKDFKDSTAQVVGPAYPNYYPYSGPGSPYYGQPSYGVPLGLPTIGGPFSGPYSYPYPYSSYNPTTPYPFGPSPIIYAPPSNGDARVSSKARP